MTLIMIKTLIQIYNHSPYVSNESDLSGQEDEIHTLMQDIHI